MRPSRRGATLAVGALQAAILFLVTVFAVGLKPVHPWATYGFMVLMVAMVMAMIQMFNALFGAAVGRVVTLAFLMIMLTSAGGIYPVQTAAKPFQYIHWVDPMTYTVNGLRQLTVGGIDYRLWVALAVISGLIVIFLAISRGRRTATGSTPWTACIRPWRSDRQPRSPLEYPAAPH